MLINIKVLLLIAIGGGLGAVLRYLLNGFAQSLVNKPFPFGILLVNMLGCVLIGCAYSYFSSVDSNHSEELKRAISVGFLGGLTTFSTFSLDNYHFYQQAEYFKMVLNTSANVLLTFIAVGVGFYLGRKLAI